LCRFAVCAAFIKQIFNIFSFAKNIKT
jgi:hypothetical protein